MIYISHRGNLNGIVAEQENSLSYIQQAIDHGVHVEIDLRLQNGQLFLGHDYCQYTVSAEWLEERKHKLWIHIKDWEALRWITECGIDFWFFCHQSDAYTLTSNGYIWSHDLTNTPTNLCIIPVLSKESVTEYRQTEQYAVCSDYILDCQTKFG